MDLTPRQADVILYVRNHRHLHGYAPSVREISATLQISRATVMGHINRLEKKGLLRRTAGHHRTLEVVDDSSRAAPARPQPRPKKSIDERLAEWRSTA